MQSLREVKILQSYLESFTQFVSGQQFLYLPYMSKTSQPYLFEFGKIGDSTIGYISVAESRALPFVVQRVYWTYFTPHEVIRGHHAHKTLQQIIVAVAGEIT